MSKEIGTSSLLRSLIGTSRPLTLSREERCRREVAADAPTGYRSILDFRTSFMENLRGSPVVFELELICEKTTSDQTLILPSDILSKTVRKFKLCLETHYSIPACCQTISSDAIVLKDDVVLSHYCKTDGNSFKVEYDGIADVNEILEALEEIRHFHRLLRSYEGTLKKKADVNTLTTLLNLDLSEVLEKLSSFYLLPRSGNALPNSAFFVDCGGVTVLRLLHEELLKHSWFKLPAEIQLLEVYCNWIYWNLTMLGPFFKVMSKSNILRCTLKSFLRLKINIVNGIQPPVMGAPCGRERQEINISSYSLIQRCMGTIANFCEIPDCRFKIASNELVLDQLLTAMLCRKLQDYDRIIIMGGISCLTFSVCTHRYLTSEHVISAVMMNCQESLKQLQFFSVVFFASLFSTSHYLLSMNTKRNILLVGESFLDTTKVIDDKMIDDKYDIDWSTVLPYFKLAYHPPSSFLQSVSKKEDVELFTKLNRLCIHCGLFSLSVILKSEMSKRILIKENLMDFRTCLPWIYPQGSTERKQASQLMALIHPLPLSLQPPSLVNVAKAKLASDFLGLERVVSGSTSQIKADVRQ